MNMLLALLLLWLGIGDPSGNSDASLNLDPSGLAAADSDAKSNWDPNGLSADTDAKSNWDPNG